MSVPKMIKYKGATYRLAEKWPGLESRISSAASLLSDQLAAFEHLGRSLENIPEDLQKKISAVLAQYERDVETASDASRSSMVAFGFDLTDYV